MCPWGTVVTHLVTLRQVCTLIISLEEKLPIVALLEARVSPSWPGWRLGLLMIVPELVWSGIDPGLQ